MSHKTIGKTSRRDFLRRAGGALACAAAPSLARQAAAAGGGRKFNLVFILCDDLGWRDTSLYGSTFHRTPHIDALAQRGMMFMQAYAASPLCSPTRASIQTGLYPARIGITSPACHLKEEKFEASVRPKAPPTAKVLICDTATRLKQEYYTLAEALKDAGYATGHFGKWHLGHEPYDPLHQGFDVDVPHWPGPGPAGSYVAPWKFTNFTGKDGEHIEDRMANEADAFLRKNKDRPFYLNYWCFSVHSPHDAKKGLIEKYRALAKPDSPQHHPVYGAMIESLDDAVGRLMGTLDELGLTDKTIVIFFSDNGGVHWPSKQCLPVVPVTSNAPLRGGKATMYEGGTREPCLVVWPGVVRGGSRSEEIVSSVDFYPTILEMLGLKPKEGQTFDGISFVPALKQSGSLGREAIFCFFPHEPAIPEHIGPSVYVRKGDWKLIRIFHDGANFAHRYELYNLKDDLSETTNLADRMPEKVRELDALIESFLRDTRAVLPKPNPDYRPSSAAAGAAGWTASKDAAVAFRDGRMVITSSGKDPWVSTRGLTAPKGPYTLELRLTSGSSGGGQVYWSTAKQARYAKEQSVPLAVRHDGQPHDYQVELPVKEAMTALRLDPSSGAGEILVEVLRLKGPAGETVKEWRFDK